MKSRITKTVALAALMAGSAGVAHATEGWYGRADVGYSIDGQTDVSGPGGIHFTLGLDHDYGEHLGMGYAFSNGLRLEGELGHRFNQFNDSDMATSGITDGDVHVWSAMANVFYDFNRGGAIEPYIGVGAGAASINYYITNGGNKLDDDDTVFAWQAMVGASIALHPQWALDIGYRYFEADNASYKQTPSPADYDVDYKHQELTVGLRYQFAAPPPPPPPPAPPPPPPPPPPPMAVACPQSDFTVYFEWDHSNLNQAALDTIDAAANRARQCNITNVTVVGHTDTSGSAQYNIGLSNRRASVVRDALVARGISAGSISASGVGETDLAKPTRDGVREPDNRRSVVNITFH